MDFIFKGFHDTDAIRQFVFECVKSDRSKQEVVVEADIGLARKYNILIQDLPLLCRGILEANQASGFPSLLTVSERQMTDIRAAVLQKAAERKPGRRAKVTAATGQAWRGGPIQR